MVKKIFIQSQSAPWIKGLQSPLSRMLPPFFYGIFTRFRTCRFHFCNKKKSLIFLLKPYTSLVVLLYKHENLSRVTSEIHVDGANKGHLVCNIVQIHCF